MLPAQIFCRRAPSSCQSAVNRQACGQAWKRAFTRTWPGDRQFTLAEWIPTRSCLSPDPVPRPEVACPPSNFWDNFSSAQSRILPCHDGHQATGFEVAEKGVWFYSITVKIISFKVSPEEEREIRSRARQQRLTVSQFLRQQATAPLRPVSVLELRLCPLTGAMVFASAESLPPLNVETTRQMLADFP